jgi:putative DNA primase/helicase
LGENWTEPREIVEALLPVPAFDMQLLPEPIGRWVADAADRTQCPPEFPAVGAVVAIGSIIGRGVTIRPKQYDDWTVVPNLWGAIVGRPGTLKSPALGEALRHVRHLEADEYARHVGVFAEWEVTSEITKARRGSIVRKGARSSADASIIKAEALAVQEVPNPMERRFLVNDTTVEKLGEVLAGSPRGVLVVRDELTGWLSGLDKDGHESDRPFYLEAWNGTGAFTYDRIGRGTVRIPVAAGV